MSGAAGMFFTVTGVFATPLVQQLVRCFSDGDQPFVGSPRSMRKSRLIERATEVTYRILIAREFVENPVGRLRVETADAVTVATPITLAYRAIHPIPGIGRASRFFRVPWQ